jgi:acid phosphatase type 7
VRLRIPLFPSSASSDPEKGDQRSPPFPAGLGWFLVLSILLVVCCTVTALEDSGGVFPTPGKGITWGPYITNTTGNSTTIHWVTGQPVPGRIEYSTIPGDGSIPSRSERHEDQDTNIHHILLEDLIPGRVYSYHIDGDTQEYSFRTYPASGPLRFVVYGDTREQLPDWDQNRLHALVAGRIASEKECLFVVHTGDLVNDPADAKEWGRFFHATAPMLGNMTFYPVPGNHEDVLTEYGHFFGLPAWYSFRCGDVTFLVLDSNSLSPVFTEAQDLWLDQDTGELSPWRFAGVHHPIFSSDIKHWGGYADVRDNFEPIFQREEIQAVFSAHVHAYEHYEVQGIHYFTLGTGGAPFYPLSPDKPAGYQSSMENTLAYARVTIDRDTCLIEVIPVARVWDGLIIPYPPGMVAERVMIKQSPVFAPGLWLNMVPDVIPLFERRIPFRL